MAIRCRACGQDNRDGASYCRKCGSRLDVDPGADPLVGCLLADRYRVTRVLGEGGMGRVYLAEQQLGTATRKVAIKVLHGSHSDDETLRRRFYGECEVVVQLTHPNTIQFHDFGELPDGRLYIVMEHIEGESLAEAMAAGPMPLARVDRILTQIAGSLAEAHAHGIVHRDLKPENVLLTSRGGEADFVKVCDFGIAKRTQGAEVSALTLRGTVVGTPRYMSPEQLTGADVDGRSDVYSLGLILFEMLTGEPPFTASSPAEWAARHTTSEPKSLDAFPSARELPPHRKQAVMAALAKLPHERPATAKALAAAFMGQHEEVTPAPAPRTPIRVDQTAPTLHASPAAGMHRATLSEPVLRPAGVRSRGRVVATLLAFTLGAAGLGGAAFVTLRSGTTAGVPDDAGVETDSGASDGGPPDAGDAEPEPADWIRMVQLERNVTDAALALGPPDGRYAVVRPGGTLNLEAAAGTRIATDGAAGPDILIRIDDERSGPYRADVGVDSHRYTTVGSAIVGSLPLDADQYGIDRIRYVRIKNRGRENLYVDAVGVYRTERLRPGEP